MSLTLKSLLEIKKKGRVSFSGGVSCLDLLYGAVVWVGALEGAKHEAPLRGSDEIYSAPGGERSWRKPPQLEPCGCFRGLLQAAAHAQRVRTITIFEVFLE